MIKFLKILSQVVLAVTILIILVGAGTVWYFGQQLPNPDELRDVQMQVPLRVYSADHKLIAEFGNMRRQPVPLKDIPVQLQHALIATEDQRFYDHSGVDFLGLGRAALEVWATGKKVQGGSTITMQVARNFFLNRKKTYTRKIREILLALKIGRELPKDKVLELYLNKVYFGKRAYGVQMAAKTYYGVPVNQLTLPQMAMLAGLPQAPSALNPLNNAKAALKRRNHVLWRMFDQKYITEQQYQQAKQAALSASYHHLRIDINAPYIAEMVRDAMVKEFGEQAYTMGLTVTTTINSKDQLAANRAVEQGLLAYDKRHGYRGVIAHWDNVAPETFLALTNQLTQLPSLADIQPAVVTEVEGQSVTILLSNGEQVALPWAGISWAKKQFQQGKWVGKAPEKASDVLSVGDVVYVRQMNNKQWTLSQIPEAEAALVSVNPENGQLLALVGGFNFNKSKFNRAISAERQPGSGFKPFIYSAALSKGYTLASMINDAPIVQADKGETDLWRPQNDNLTFNGPTRLRVGLMRSRNLVTIRLLRAVGIPYATAYAKRFGFADTALPQGLSLALGSGVLTPLELARGLSVFANGGFLIKPYLIQKVSSEDGKVLFQAAPVQACLACEKTADTEPSSENLAPRIITEQNAYLINSAMKSVITRGTGRGARVLNRHDLAGKTGTTNDQNDAWFSGFNTKVLTVAWLGFDQPRSTYEYGAQAALPIWLTYMRTALKGVPESNLPQPEGIVSVRINSKTGKVTTANDKQAIFELFRAQYAPKLVEHMTPADSLLPHGQGDSSADEQPIF